MSIGVRSVLDIATQALFGNQAAIATTSNNVANVNTEGYSRRSVRFEEGYSIDYKPGQIGTGVQATEVVRHFDMFVEAQFLDKSTLDNRYQSLWQNLQSVDNLVNESKTDGIHALLSQFFNDWQKLSQNPDDYSMRESLTGDTQSLLTLLNSVDSDLADLQQLASNTVADQVTEVNQILNEIAAVNQQISVHEIPGQNNVNQLLDERDRLVRELSEYIDVDVLGYQSTGVSALGNRNSNAQDWTLVTKAGQTLIQGSSVFKLSYEGPQAWNSLSGGSNFDGEIKFDGDSSFEYTLQVVSGGSVAAASNASGAAAMFRVSMDGGRTWLKDDDGNVRLFAARPESESVDIEGVEVWFEGATQPLQDGDMFTIMPKNGLYWYKTTSDKVNITPLVRADGSDDTTRLTGGSITANLSFIGGYAGKYRDKIDSMAETLIWETNRAHSQGAGLTMFNSVIGDYSVRDSSIALGDDSSGLHWSDKLSSGNLQVYFYNAASGDLSNSASYGALDFDPSTPGVQNFDPGIHSLSNVAAAFNSSFGSYLTASVVDNKLQLDSKAGYTFGFGTDSTGLLAGLGINTYFSGTGSSNIAINDDIVNDSNRINAGKINGAGQANSGDNVTATAVAELATKDVTIQSVYESTSSQTLLEYYATTVAIVGGDTAGSQFLYNYNHALAEDLNERQQSVAGVNLDEEMTDLIKYQNSYQSAAKLITTADEMMQTVLGLKQ